MMMFSNILKCWSKIPRTTKHYFAYMSIQKKLLGRYKYWFHDLDKIVMYIFLPFLGVTKIQKIHRRYNKHHITVDKTNNDIDYLAAIIDWESCRYTKPDEPMNAREFAKYALAKREITIEQYSKVLIYLKYFNL